MLLKRLLNLLIILGFLVGCTFSTRTFTPAGSSAALLSAAAIRQPLAVSENKAQQALETWGVYLPIIIKSTPLPATPTPTATSTATQTSTSTPTPTSTATRTSTPNSSGCILTHNGAFEQQLYDLINNQRLIAGLAPLSANYTLEISSGEHSDDMAINHFLSHTGSDGSTFWQRAVAAGYTGHWGGEIIMMGVSTPAEAVDWWMGDAPHRDMILGDLNDFGAGYAHCSDSYYTVDFGHR